MFRISFSASCSKHIWEAYWASVISNYNLWDASPNSYKKPSKLHKFCEKHFIFLGYQLASPAFEASVRNFRSFCDKFMKFLWKTFEVFVTSFSSCCEKLANLLWETFQASVKSLPSLSEKLSKLQWEAFQASVRIFQASVRSFPCFWKKLHKLLRKSFPSFSKKLSKLQ